MLSAGKPASSALRRPARGRALRAQADSAGVLDKYPVEQTADDEPFQRVVGELAAALDALADEAHVIRDVEDPVEHADPIPRSVLGLAGTNHGIAEAPVEPSHDAARQRAFDVAEQDNARHVGLVLVQDDEFRGEEIFEYGGQVRFAAEGGRFGLLPVILGRCVRALRDLAPETFAVAGSGPLLAGEAREELRRRALRHRLGHHLPAIG